MKKCCVVIPIYKTVLNSVEQVVLNHFLQKIQNYPWCFMAPSDLDLRWYQNNYPEIAQQVFAGWKSDSLDDYNQLMMKPSFYKRFDDYGYIFIFQLDGFILKDDGVLNEFLDMDYDYIGAPFPGEGFRYLKRIIPGSGHISLLNKLQGETICRVGNGGVSLRKVEAMIRFFHAWEAEKSEWNNAEDIFISFYGQKRKCKLNIAPVEIASRFSLETNMKMKITNGNIPFAVHKWERYYPELLTDYMKYI